MRGYLRLRALFIGGLALALVVGGAQTLRAAEPALPAGLGSAPAKTDAVGTEPDLPLGLVPEKKELPGREPSTSGTEGSGFPLHGFVEGRVGPRLRSDDTQSEEFTLGEARLQLEGEKYLDAGTLEATADLLLDGVTEEVKLDLRQARFTFSPLPSIDLRVGRQVLSWGTGDLLFINDLFPKDWVSFLIGRDVDYLKAPADALRVGWFRELFNLEIVYTPRFEPDRYIDGERLSFWNPALGAIAGEEHRLSVEQRNEWFEEDEVAVRLYRNFSGYEAALYGYSGYWKSPAGQNPVTGRHLFPKLDVYGASLQGALGPGIANIEAGYYNSRDDREGDDPTIKNSEVRLLLGYEQELAREFTGSVQYYLEHMRNYSAYRDRLPPGVEPRDEDRHLLTLRLTKLLMGQNLTLSLFTFYSPSDRDAYVRPGVNYKVDDSWTVMAGANLFLGDQRHTFFGQFEDNSNVYLGMRYSF